MPSVAVANVASDPVAAGAKPKTVFRPDIQGLRMVAVSAVILDHLIGWPSGGFVGVDVFFVISGFLITGLLLREHERTGTISFTGFYRRRVKRIIPVAMLVIILTVFTAWFLFNRTRFWSTFWDGFWATFFASNWRFAAVGTDYFQAEAAVSPLQHYWSLSVEEQFYFVWPWVMLLIFALTAKRWSAAAGRRVAGIVMAVVVVASFLWSMQETQTNTTVAYFSTLSRAWELGIGALIAVFASSFRVIPSWARPILAWVGLAGIVVSLFVVSAENAFPAPWAALPVLATALVIIGGTGGDQHHVWPLTNPFSRYVGDISYSLYVWHWPIIVFGTMLWGDDPLVLLSLLAAIILVSVYSYHFFEDPIRRSDWLEPRTPQERRRRRRKRRQSVGGLTTLGKVAIIAPAVLISGGLAFAAMTPRVPPASAGSSGPAFQQEQPPADAAAGPTASQALAEEMRVALSATSYPADLNPTIDEALAGPQAPNDVMPCGQPDSDEAACTWGDPNATHTAVLVGNSLSMTYVAALREALGTDRGWRVIAYGMFGCPFTDYSIDSAENYPNGCSSRPDDAIAAINRLNPDVVVVSGIRKPETAASQLAKMTVDPAIVTLPGPPITDLNIVDCYNPMSSPADCIVTVPQGWATDHRDLAKVVGGTFVNSVPWFCVDKQCPAFVGTTPTRRDRVHMTPEYAVKIAPAVRETLEALPAFSATPAP